MNYDYKLFYENLTRNFRSPGKIRVVGLANKFLTGLTYLSYPLMLCVLFLKKDPRIFKMVLIPGISFVLLSAVRKLINRKRPYESWDIDPIIKKDTRGKSMPSRHVFSMVIIAISFLSVNTALGCAFLMMAFLLAFLRVLGGVHYPSDVLAGILCAAAAGVFFLI